MVPEENGLLVNKLSLYGTLQEILQQLCNLADEKKKVISNQDWERLSTITNEQNDLKGSLSVTERRLERLLSRIKTEDILSKDTADTITENLIAAKKEEIKKMILQYREAEAINVALLKDALYVAKLKASKLFNNAPFGGNTYSVGKNNRRSGAGAPVMFRRTI
ncbi:MAG: flagellar export chaperone FlgN [Spirochaetales bacterium]|nr:flagellar export chaperone FlgN [Spirochaetales bacterium]